MQVEGRWHWRSYSLTSVPTRGDGTISITVKAMPEGFLSGHLVGGLEPGTVVRLAAPRGDFVLPDPPPQKVLFLTAGSGLTPVMGMLRMLDRRETMPDVVLVHSAPQRAGRAVPRGAAPAGRQAPDPDACTSSTPTPWACSGSTGCRGLVPDWAERETWACGPPAMLDDAERRVEARAPDRPAARRALLHPARRRGRRGRHRHLRRRRPTAEVDGATTLLEAGEAAGVQMPFGCRMGICQSCVVPLVAGSVRDLRNGTVHAEGDRIQTCISAAAGDCVLGV